MVTSGLGTSNTRVAIDGFIEVKGFDSATDVLVVTYYVWNSGTNSYDDNMTKTLTPFTDSNNEHNGIFLVTSIPMMFVKYIDWFRNEVLITDPDNLTGLQNINAKKQEV